MSRIIVVPAAAIHIPFTADENNDYPILWNDKNFINDYHIAEVKKDGSRYCLYLDAPGKSLLLSKRISEVTGQYVDKTLNCPHLTRVAIPEQFWGTVFDGEIVNPAHLKSDGTTSIMGCGPEKAVARQKESGWVEYHIYDVPFYCGVDIRQKPLHYRREIMKLVTNLLNTIIPIQYCKAVSAKDAERLYKKVISMGGEGIMLKDLRSFYGEGWFKVKRVRTWDVCIMGFEPAKTHSKKVDGTVSETAFHAKGLVGSIKFGMYQNGVLVELGTCSGFSEKLRREMSARPQDFIGKVIEIKAQERTKTGKFRHARVAKDKRGIEKFRDDKAPSQCVDTGDK